MTSYNDRRLEAIRHAIMVNANVLMSAEAEAREILAALDRVTPDDHVDHDQVRQTLEATGDIPPTATEDLAEARTKAAERKMVATKITAEDVAQALDLTDVAVGDTLVTGTAPGAPTLILQRVEGTFVGTALEAARTGERLHVRLDDPAFIVLGTR